MRLILLIIIIFFVGCDSGNPKLHSNNPDKIFYIKNCRFNCFKLRTIKDSITLYKCYGYDTLTNIIMVKGNYLIYKDNYKLPTGWVIYYNKNGGIDGAEEYCVFDVRREELNQFIAFGKDSLDTLYSQSKFLKHTFKYLNNDSIRIHLRFRGWRENISNYAYTVGDINKVVFRTNKPDISFDISKTLFVDSNLSIVMIKTSDSDSGKDSIIMEHIYYDIKMQKK